MKIPLKQCLITLIASSKKLAINHDPLVSQTIHAIKHSRSTSADGWLYIQGHTNGRQTHASSYQRLSQLPPGTGTRNTGYLFYFQNKDRITVFVPLGLKPFFSKRGYKNVQELDWQQSTELDEIKLTALPAVHFSGRGIGDGNETLWCSWAIRSASTNIFFSGNTGYSPTVFKAIGKQFRSFDMAIVPIGAYDPANVMQPVHTNPEEAIQMANDVRADLIIPSHWGTIALTDEPPFEPPERYRAYANKIGISDERASIMKIGETRTV
ncbi:MAG: hypothetical protein DRH90_22010 [Deltaproteobacteria bacterium]|nr:MAG: hypothetical protein DRH90_22010 [Deltaproteobacteria bacterium]